jgi:hypothetical protein
MVIDANSQPIQVLTPGTLVNDSVSTASRASTLPTGATVVEVAVNTDCWILFGAGGAVANTTGMFMPKGSVVYGIPVGATSLSYIRDAADGRISITKLD